MLNGTVVQYNIKTFNGVQKIYPMEWVIVHLKTIYKYILISKYFLIEFIIIRILKKYQEHPKLLPGPSYNLVNICNVTEI